MRQTADILKATLKQQGVMPNFTINERLAQKTILAISILLI